MCRKRNLSLLTIFVLPFLLISCVTWKNSYIWEGVNYDSPEKALAAEKKDFDLIVSKIGATKSPIGGSAIVILPSRAYIRNIKLYTISGSWPTKETKEDMVNYLTEGDVIWLNMSGEALKKRTIFNSISITYSDEPQNATFNEDIAVMAFIKEGKGQWFLKKKGHETDMITIEEVSTALPPLQRMISWLDNVEKATRSR